MWIVDPIDSTRSFQRGIPTWNILVGYQKDDEMILGVSYYPMFNDIYFELKRVRRRSEMDKPIHRFQIRNH